MKDFYLSWLWPIVNLFLLIAVFVCSGAFGFFSWPVLAVVIVCGFHWCGGELFEIDGEAVMLKDVLWHVGCFVGLGIIIILGILA